ncbi:dTMP kinase [Enterovirga rhinocerotis]|uniref:Thymidylate kinase n=1 Tax=Enterovirga rhinocerotis TaxID=1339210 RepID=A0A4R7CA89_9HYPH|nr:dTMP kinase [Enterovirga rhinocerotis]TDR94285.1 thymidylate kinase [Enterovirga rhinocerotis]
MSLAPPSPPPARGFFVTFEGGEGAGKSTQIDRLRNRLAATGREILVTREPGGSPRAEAIRSIILSGLAKSAGPLAESALFAAARADHVDRVIRPALERGAVVLCDRFTDSTRVYQGLAGGLEPGILDRLDEAATAGIRPDLTIVIDVPVALGSQRARLRRSGRGEGIDRFEGEDAPFHERVRQGFLDLAASAPGRCVVVDGSQAIDVVGDAIWAEVSVPRGRKGA